MRITLRRKIITLACLAALIPVVVMFIITSVLEHRLSSTVNNEVKGLITEHVSQVAVDAYDQCHNTELMIHAETERALKGTLKYLNSLGRWHLGDKLISWTLNSAENQGTVQLPEIFIGDKSILPVERIDAFSELVDSVKGMTGADCCIFQRVNPEGDMLAVASSEEAKNKTRSIGYLKKSLDPDGRRNDVIKAVLDGEEVYERGEEQYGTRLVIYSPLKDSYGHVIGMVGVHMTFQSVKQLLRNIVRTSVGKSGYIWLIGTRGAYRNKYIVTPSTSGKIINSSRETSLVKELASSAMDAGDGKLSSKSYTWSSSENGTLRDKYAVYTYFEPWGWVIGASVYMDDYQGIIHKLTGTMHSLTELLVISGIIILVVILGISFYMSGLIANPVSHMAKIAAMIAKGDINQARREIITIEQVCPNAKRAVLNAENNETLDETGQLYLTIKEMAENLNSLVGQVQRSGIQVTASATEIAASARQLDETVNTQAAATNQISATSLEISANAGELAGTMDKVNISAKGAADLAEEGKDGLRSMIRIMDDLSSATDNIIEKLASINEQAISIVYIVTTITKVADRTNLLSLNAAIEAEKAGEFGQGFSVVADEIRRLADQTSVAALEIENMISSMREAVDSGVSEMDRFAKEVHHGTGKAAKLGKKLDGIMQMVTELNPRIQSVNEGMTAQAEGAQQISQSMTQLSASASQTSDSLGEFNRAASQLNEAVQGLQSEVSKFRVG
jgi:methyl-accepting chemotaxis protein WspA